MKRYGKFSKVLMIVLIQCLILYILSGCRKSETEHTGTTSKVTVKTSVNSTSATTNRSATKVSTTTQKTTNKSDDSTDAGSISTPDSIGDEEIVEPEEEYGGDEGPFAAMKFDTSNLDLGGKTMTLKSWNNWPAQDDNPSNMLFWARIRKAEKLLNVKYNLITIPGATNYMNTAVNDFLAGINFSDEVYATSPYIVPSFIKIGMGIPLDDYIDYNHPSMITANTVFKYIDGKHYAMGGLLRFASWETIYNANLINSEGLTDILELYKEGSWTWDIFLDYCIKATRDRNGDGIIDQFAVGATALINMINASNGAVKVELTNSGFEFGLKTKPAELAFSFFRDLVYVHKVSHPGESFQNGNQLMTFGFSWNSSWYRLNTGLGSATLTAPLPAGPNRSGDTVVTDTINMYMVNPLSQFKPEEVIASYYLRGYNDPNDPECFRDDYTSYMQGNQKYFSTEEETDFWYHYTTNPERIIIDYNLGFGEVDTILNNEVFPPIKAGEHFKSHLDKAIPQIEASIAITLN